MGLSSQKEGRRQASGSGPVLAQMQHHSGCPQTKQMQLDASSANWACDLEREVVGTFPQIPPPSETAVVSDALSAPVLNKG